MFKCSKRKIRFGFEKVEVVSDFGFRASNLKTRPFPENFVALLRPNSFLGA